MFKINDDYKELLPDKICYKCSDALTYATQIRSLCLDSDKLLKKQLSDLNLLKPVNENKVELTFTEAEHCEEVYLEAEEFEADLNHIESEVDEVEVETVDEVEDETVGETKESIDVACDIEDDEFFGAVDASTAPKLTYEPLRRSSHKVCEICGKTYTRNYLAYHLKTHDLDKESKQFKCE